MRLNRKKVCFHENWWQLSWIVDSMEVDLAPWKYGTLPCTSMENGMCSMEVGRRGHRSCLVSMDTSMKVCPTSMEVNLLLSCFHFTSIFLHGGWFHFHVSRIFFRGSWIFLHENDLEVDGSFHGRWLQKTSYGRSVPWLVFDSPTYLLTMQPNESNCHWYPSDGTVRIRRDRSNRQARLLSQAFTDKHHRSILFLYRIDSDFTVHRNVVHVVYVLRPLSQTSETIPLIRFETAVTDKHRCIYIRMPNW